MPPAASTFTFNKHIVAALIITPILAIIAWLAIDFRYKEQPHAAVKGGYYELLALPNCRYESGRCSLRNGDLELDLSVEFMGDGNMNVKLLSTLPLNGVRLAIIEASHGEEQSIEMHQNDGTDVHWQGLLPQPASTESRLRLAVAAEDSFFYADVATAFTHYQTAFDRDFRRSTESN